MPLPDYIEGRVASLADITGTVTIDTILVNNTVLYVGEQTSVSQDTLTTIVTVPSNGVKYITKIMCSGEENARWDVYIDSVRKFTLRTTDRNVDFEFSTPLKIAAASVVDVKATHHGPDTTANFQASVLGYQETP